MFEQCEECKKTGGTTVCTHMPTIPAMSTVAGGGLPILQTIGVSTLNPFTDEPASVTRVRAMVTRLMTEFENSAENPLGLPQDAPKQTPALPCQITMKSGYRTEGVLSITPEGCLRFLSQGRSSQHGPPDLMIEHFFDWIDLESVLILRKVEPTRRSKIVEQ